VEVHVYLSSSFIRTEVRLFPPITMHQVIMSEGQSFLNVIFSQLYFRSQLRSFLSVNKWGVASGFVTGGEVFGAEHSRRLLLLEHLGLSSIRSSVHTQIRFSNSLSSSIFLHYFFLHVLRMRRFVSLLGTVACGVHSVLFEGGNVGRGCSHSQSE